MRRPALWLCLLAPLLPAIGRAQLPPITKLMVHVVNDSDKPVDRASVIVRFVAGRAYLKLGKKIRETYELRTNQEGEAKVPEIPQGMILVQVIAKGYQTFGQTFEIEEAERTVEIKLNPPQKQYSAHEN
ncbi:MAG: carboxypeptidase regulatory-like domain-containing protein [Acidobacteriia bacterium]|nr:carboxypeptidase regulatory-like domain-containing protein [Terriglobia bacterium]